MYIDRTGVGYNLAPLSALRESPARALAHLRFPASRPACKCRIPTLVRRGREGTLRSMTTPTTPVPFEVWTSERGEEGFLHGTKADLKVGDLIEPGRSSNYGSRPSAAFVYFTATLDAATWGAELAVGDGPGHIYIVEPTSAFEDDPNLTDKKFPGNPTRSYRTRAPLRVIGEVSNWSGHTPDQLQAMKDGLARLAAQGIEAINE
jgi:hypothetical protein